MFDVTPVEGQKEQGGSQRSDWTRMQINSTTALICPNVTHRRMLTQALESQHSNVSSTLGAYPAYNQVLSLIDLDCDAFIIELDTDPAAALDLVQAICSQKLSATVMVYAKDRQPDMLIRSMQAGAREFLSGAIAPEVLTEALVRAVARRAESTARRKPHGKVFVYWGAKGGSGVTTLATNFAIALRRETGGEVALLDLNPQLGDIAVLLGVVPRFTIAEAFLNSQGLDEEFVSTLVTEHHSGVSVLAAPDTYSCSIPADDRSVEKLIDLVAKRFPYVVIDAGPGLGGAAKSLFQAASTIYLVTQLDILSLRNTQRFLAHLRQFGEPRVELVINRFESRKVEFDDERLTKTLGLRPQWKIPNDFSAVRRASNMGTPLVSEKLPISQALRDMARAACGKLPENEGKKSFRLFR
jgi:pilus assembly protein CpaE